MVVNPSNSEAIIIDKEKNCHTGEILKINVKIRKGFPLKLFVIQIDDQLNFNLHIFNICRSAANQLNSHIRLFHVFDFEEKKILINSYFCLNFGFCPLVRTFSSAKTLNKVDS